MRGLEPEALKYVPKYVLRSFTASGADSNEYDINDHSNHDHDYTDFNDNGVPVDHSVIYIRNVKNKKVLWEAVVGFTRPMGLELREAPDKKHALLSFTFGQKGEDLYWLHLPYGKPSAEYIDAEKFEKLALKACGNVSPDHVDRHLYYSWFYFLDWDAQGRCRLKWECEYGDSSIGYHTNVGIAIVTIGSNGKLSLTLDSFLTDVDTRKARYGKHVTLKK